jgi:hypothetical protein
MTTKLYILLNTNIIITMPANTIFLNDDEYRNGLFVTKKIRVVAVDIFGMTTIVEYQNKLWNVTSTGNIFILECVNIAKKKKRGKH